MTNVEAIIFDKDGTLFDFQATWAAWAKGVIAEVGKGDSSREEGLANALGFDRANGVFHPSSVMIASPFDVTVSHVHSAIGGDYDALFAPMLRLARETPQAHVPGMAQAIQAMAKTYVLGLVTNDAIDPTERHIGDAGLTPHFAFIAGADSGFGAKPEPGQLLGFAEKTGIDPARTLMVGDSTHDLHAAAAAGMRPVAVLTGVATREDLSPFAEVVLPDLTHIPDWIAAQQAS